MKRKPKIKLKYILILVLIILLAFPLTAFAQSVTGQMGDVLSEFLGKLGQFLTIVLKVLQRILWPIFLAIGGLLNNDILFGYGMEERLLEVWVQMRNIVNVGFVIILLGVALFNVLAVKPDSEYAIKTFLPKFAIALIAVNFSYIAMKVVLDVTNVATTAVFTLPSTISTGVNPQILECEENKKAEDCTVKDKDIVKKICTAYYGNEKEFEKKFSEQTADAKRPVLCTLEGGSYTLQDAGKKFFARYNSRNAGLVMAIQFMNVLDVDKVSASASKDLTSLAFNLLFSVILYIVYGAAYLALFVVLLARLVALWLFIALSPFIAIALVVPNLIPSAGGELQNKFFKNAFAPFLMGVPLTIGYVILDAFKNTGTKNNIEFGTAFNMVQVEASGISDLQSMIIAFAAVAVVWIGVFAAAEGTIAERFTEGIKGKVGAMGRGATNLLKLVPIIPAGQGGKGLSYKQALGKIRQPFDELEKEYGAQRERSNMSPTEIRNVAKNTESTVEEGRRAVLSGLQTAAGQREAYKLLQKWKSKGKFKQSGFAKRVLGELGEKERKAFAQGKLRPAAKQRIKGAIRRVAPGTSPRNRRSASSTTKSGGAASGAAAGGAATTTANAPTPASTVSTAKQSGVAVSEDLQELQERRVSAAASGNNAEVQKIDTQMKEDHKDELEQLQKINKASPQIAQVRTSAGAVQDADNTEQVQKLENSLTAADNALKAQIPDDDKRKEILGQVLKKAAGDKASDIAGKSTKVANLVKL
ncbi:hypothetical protein GF369_00530 [Candidatus Peregrinibacteria bacterium]|nr:hypothetical protein [Candidatus Peregrinibacteria bacterium]